MQPVPVDEVGGYVPHSFTLESFSCGCHYHVRHRFLPDISGTCVRIEMDMRPVSLIAKLMSPLSLLMSVPIKKLIEADLNDLKSVAETRANTVEHAY